MSWVLVLGLGSTFVMDSSLGLGPTFVMGSSLGWVLVLQWFQLCPWLEIVWYSLFGAFSDNRKKKLQKGSRLQIGSAA